MKLKQLKCPSCGAGIEVDLKGRRTAFCPYCGSQFSVDDGVTRAEYHYNYNHTTSCHKRYTDDAAVEKERRKDRENARDHKEIMMLFIGMGLMLLFSFGFMFYEDIKEQKKIDSGMIQVGQSDEDLVGKDYHAVVAQLESAGFKNITTVDLDDSFLFFTPADSVESVTIGGKANSYSSELFDPNTPIVISYH